MKYFYAIILGLMVLVSACAQQTQPVAKQSSETGDSNEAGDAVEEKPSEDVEVAKQVVEESLPSTTEIQILGAGAFEPDDVSISVGDSVTWINTDNKVAVIIIFKDGRAYTNSQTFQPGEQFEHEFNEEGSYQFWRNVAFSSDGGTITVE